MKHATGNRHFTREGNRVDLVNLTLFWLVRPKAYIDEVRAYVHNQNPVNLPYSQSQIVRVEHRLGLTRKAASSTSDRAQLPLNMHIRYLYRNAPFPDGVLGESTRDIIDLDESKFKIEDQNRRFGKVAREKLCDASGKYMNESDGIDLLMAISGDERVDQAFSFHRCYTKGNTDLWRFYSYTDDFFIWLAANHPRRQFLFTLDNLNLHKSPIVLNLIHTNGHRIVYRAPYWSCDGAIEYIFNTIQTKLQMDTEWVDSIHGLVNKIML